MKRLYLFLSLFIISASIFAQSNKLLGTWEGNGETIQFNTNTINYLGQTYQYNFSPNIITVQTAQGPIQYEYLVDGKYLTMGANGQSVIYVKKSTTTNSISKSSPNNSAGRIDQSMVGKWCYVNVNSTNSGGSSSSECVTLNGNGTYEYYSESSRSVNTQDYYGGTNSQGADRGTWKVQGNTLIVNSQTQGNINYPFEKRNHPKNGDPMLVIDGRTFVTYFQKNPW